MRYLIVGLVLVFLTAVFAAGCGQKEQAADKQQTSAEKVKQEAKETVEAATTYTMEQKDQYLAALDEQLKQYDGKIEDLKKQAQMAGEDTKASLMEKVQDLETKREAVSAQIAELKDSSGDAWTHVKAGVDASMDDLRKAYEKAAMEFHQ